MTTAETGAVFQAASADYARVLPQIWDPAGRATVARSAPRTGERVLDACCGAGSSALPAAAAVGPKGWVDAVDLAPGLLDLGRRRAAEAGLGNIAFHAADATQWSAAPGYDLVQCVYGTFLLDDMDDGTRRLVRLLRDGGRLAVTVWRHGALEDHARAFYETVDAHRPAPGPPGGPPGRAPIERVNTAESLRDWLTATLGLEDVEVDTVDGSVPLTPGLAWDLVLGSGFRGALDRLGAAEDREARVAAVRRDFLALLDRRGVDTLDVTSLVGVGVRR